MFAFAGDTSLTYISSLCTIVETPTFVGDVDRFWSPDERMEFFQWIAANPEAGIVIPDSAGCRKIRWKCGGKGKRGGVRVIYFNRLQFSEIWMLLIYPKSMKDDIPREILRLIRKEIEHG